MGLGYGETPGDEDWPLPIKTCCEAQGLNQDVLAMPLGVDQTTISRWERDVTYGGDEQALESAKTDVRAFLRRTLLR